MSWLELKIDTSEHLAPTLGDALSECGALSITFSDTQDDPVFEPALGETPLWRYTRVIGLFDATTDVPAILAQLQRRFGANAIGATHLSPLADEAWERTWMDHFAPTRFGRTLWICPSWCAPPEPNAVNIFMDPGLAFGTGTHPTTALCLEWLDANHPAQHVVVDYGCGSGILAVAAAKLGALRVIGVDHDPQALLATRENAQRNGVDTQIETYLPEHMPPVIADLVLANILANPLRELAALFAGTVKPGGQIVLSGILAEQTSEVCAAYENPFIMRAPVTKQEWARLDGTRRG